MRERRSRSSIRPAGKRASTAARASAPPGVAALSAGAASGDMAPSESGWPASSAARSTPGRRSGSTSPSQRTRSSPRRGSSPPASRAATIDPAEVPIS